MNAQRQENEGWGRSVVERLSDNLQWGVSGIKGFSAQNLWYMWQFYQEYHDSEKLQPAVGEISWSLLSSCRDARIRWNASTTSA